MIRMYTALGCLLITFFGISLSFYNSELRSLAVFQDSNSNERDEIEEIKIPKNPFENLKLEAKAAYVFDIKNNRSVFAKNASEQLPLASLTKIMTVVVAGEVMPGEEFQKESDVLDELLVESSNEAAGILAFDASEFLQNDNFVGKMNQKAKELDLKQTYFFNESGLDISKDLSGGYGSALDIAKLMIYAVKNNERLFESTRYGKVGDIANTNVAAASTSQLIASKTGFTDLAGGNLAIIFDAGFYHPMAIVVMGSSKDGRFRDVEKLIAAVYDYLAQKNKI